MFVSVHLLCCKGPSLRYVPWLGSILCSKLRRVQRGNNAACWLLLHFQSLPPLPTSKFGSSGADSQVGWFVCVLGPCGCFQQTLLWGWEFLPPLQPAQVLKPEVLRLSFPVLDPMVAQSVLLPNFSSWFIHMSMWDCTVCQPLLHLPSDQLLPCHMSSPPWLPISFPPTSLDECFFFNCFVVGLTYSSIFWKFWLFFVFKLVLILLLFVWGSKTYLPMPPYGVTSNYWIFKT